MNTIEIIHFSRRDENIGNLLMLGIDVLFVAPSGKAICKVINSYRTHPKDLFSFLRFKNNTCI